ncbi:hypothetical protein DFH06DRAFT_1168053 [Mycena polygramma]|nr:hypothetical protein DFH06DRAFT_1168053 [Mycena polygramma]
MSSQPTNMSDVSFEHILTHLASHDWEHTKGVFAGKTVDGVPFEQVVKDIKNVSLTLQWGGGTDLSIAIRGNATFTSTGSLGFLNPGTTFKQVSNAPGTIYTRQTIPAGNSEFWIQQYPASQGEAVGRTVVEFWADNTITAVFKTDNDNFGGQGKGTWM